MQPISNLLNGRFSSFRMLELLDTPIAGTFDRAHLQSIHKYIFQDIYPWAGKPRCVNMVRGNSSFAAIEFMTSYLDAKLRELAAEKRLRGLGAADFGRRPAYYLAEINAVHLFHEGNGRAQREFIRELAADAGYRINWIHVTREQMYAASERSMLREDLAGMIAVVSASIS